MREAFLLAQHMLFITPFPFPPSSIFISSFRCEYNSPMRLFTSLRQPTEEKKSKAEQIYLKHLWSCYPLPCSCCWTNHLTNVRQHFNILIGSYRILYAKRTQQKERKKRKNHMQNCHDSFLYLHINYSTHRFYLYYSHNDVRARRFYRQIDDDYTHKK